MIKDNIRETIAALQEIKPEYKFEYRHLGQAVVHLTHYLESLEKDVDKEKKIC